MAFSNDVINCIEDLKVKTTDRIASMEEGLIPAFINTYWHQVKYYIYKDKRYDDIDEDKVVIRLMNVKYKINNGRRDQLVFDENAFTAIKVNHRVHPFMLFINGYFIKWSNIEIVRELKYTYFVVSDAKRLGDTIDTVEYINIPFNITYTETRELQKNQMEMFRFDNDGLLRSWGPIIIYANIPDLYYTSNSFLNGAIISDLDLKFDKHYKLTSLNVFTFINMKLVRNINVHIKNMNVITINNGNPIECDTDKEFVYKVFFRNKVNSNISNIMIPDNDEFLKAILTRSVDSGNINIIDLEKDFNFKYSKSNDYESNVENAARYIHAYNSNLVNSIYEKRSIIKSFQYNGDVIKSKISNNILTMLRWKADAFTDTYVMVFKNGELWKDYFSIKYEANKFNITVDPEESIDENDIFEFVFFLRSNNTIVQTHIGNSYLANTKDNFGVRNSGVLSLLRKIKFSYDKKYALISYFYEATNELYSAQLCRFRDNNLYILKDITNKLSINKIKFSYDTFAFSPASSLLVITDITNKKINLYNLNEDVLEDSYTFNMDSDDIECNKIIFSKDGSILLTLTKYIQDSIIYSKIHAYKFVGPVASSINSVSVAGDIFENGIDISYDNSYVIIKYIKDNIAKIQLLQLSSSSIIVKKESTSVFQVSKYDNGVQFLPDETFLVGGNSTSIINNESINLTNAIYSIDDFISSVATAPFSSSKYVDLPYSTVVYGNTIASYYDHTAEKNSIIPNINKMYLKFARYDKAINLENEVNLLNVLGLVESDNKTYILCEISFIKENLLAISYIENNNGVYTGYLKIAQLDEYLNITIIGDIYGFSDTTMKIENRPITPSDIAIYSPFVDSPVYEIDRNDRSLYKVPFSIDSSNILSISNKYYGKNLYIVSKNQFRYCFYNVTENTWYFSIADDFKTCLDPNRYLLFINGRLIHSSMYNLLIEDNGNSFIQPTIHTRIMLVAGDRVEIFYLPDQLHYTDIGTTNKTDIYKVQAVIDKQPVFAIPFPVGNYLSSGKNSFFVMLGSVIIDPARYEVRGNKLIFINPNDYVDLGRELTFVFMYAKATSLSELDYVREKDHIVFDTEFVISSSKNQLVYVIPYPANYDSSNGGFFVTYRGLYVSPSRYTIADGVLTFKDSMLEIDQGTAMIFTFFKAQESKVVSKVIPVSATIDNQLEFNIPLPYDNYLKDHNRFFINKNGTFLEDKEDYTIDYNDSKINLTSPEGLAIGEQLVFNFIYGETLTVKTAYIEVTATEDNQKIFEIPKLFQNYINKNNKFFVIIGTTFVDRRRYTVDSENNNITLNDDDALLRGRKLTFFLIYTEDTELTDAIDLDDSAANKYTSIESIPVKADKDNQRSFNIPKQNIVLFDKNFFITIGSTFIPEDSYTKHYSDPTGSISSDYITLNDNIAGVDLGREVLFTFIDNYYSVVEKQSYTVIADKDGQLTFNIPIPFDNYFTLGNRCLVFLDGTFVDESRYDINTLDNTLTFFSSEDAQSKGKELTFLFFYVANQNNISFIHDDINIVKLPEYGYIYLSKNSISYSMNPKLYFLFINGKKIDKDSIKTVSSNLIRLNRDVQSRYNVSIIDYTPIIEEFEPYFRMFSEYDNLINKLTTEELDKLFGIYTTISNTEVKIIPNISQESIINNIIRVHYMANGISNGLPFIYSYDKQMLKDRDKDSEGNYVLDTLDANKFVNVKE